MQEAILILCAVAGVMTAALLRRGRYSKIDNTKKEKVILEQSIEKLENDANYETERNVLLPIYKNRLKELSPDSTKKSQVTSKDDNIAKSDKAKPQDQKVVSEAGAALSASQDKVSKTDLETKDRDKPDAVVIESTVKTRQDKHLEAEPESNKAPEGDIIKDVKVEATTEAKPEPELVQGDRESETKSEFESKQEPRSEAKPEATTEVMTSQIKQDDTVASAVVGPTVESKPVESKPDDIKPEVKDAPEPKPMSEPTAEQENKGVTSDIIKDVKVEVATEIKPETQSVQYTKFEQEAKPKTESKDEQNIKDGIIIDDQAADDTDAKGSNKNTITSESSKVVDSSKSNETVINKEVKDIDDDIDEKELEKIKKDIKEAFAKLERAESE